MDEKLLSFMMENKYKMVCDSIKVSILDTLINICLEREKKEGVPVLSKFDLMLIKDKIEEIREKESKEEREALVNVITSLASRGNEEVKLTSANEVQNDRL